MKEKKKMISQTTVIDMGWTKAMITKLLPEPVLKPNPNYRSAAPMKLWVEEEVIAMMQTPAYIEAKAKADKRKISAEKAVETRIVNFCAKVVEKAHGINVDILEDDVLRERTLQHQEERKANEEYRFRDYLERCQRRDERRGYYKELEEYFEDRGADYYRYFDVDGTPLDITVRIADVNEETMQRWIVNYIRHVLTHYDSELYGFKGKTGKYEASLEFKLAILDRIAECYPRYAAECERQKEYTKKKYEQEEENEEYA